VHNGLFTVTVNLSHDVSNQSFIQLTLYTKFSAVEKGVQLNAFLQLYIFFPPRPVMQMRIMTTMKRRKKQMPNPMRAAYSGGIDRNSSQRLTFTSGGSVVLVLCVLTDCAAVCL